MSTSMTDDQYRHTETVIYDANNIRIRRSVDGGRWEIEWAYEGDRSALIGAGWMAEIIAYTPHQQYMFARQFLRKGGQGVVPVSQQPIVLEYRDVYQGGSKYSHTKYGGKGGYIVIHPDGHAVGYGSRATNEIVAIVVARARVTEANQQTASV